MHFVSSYWIKACDQTSAKITCNHMAIKYKDKLEQSTPVPLHILQITKMSFLFKHLRSNPNVRS